MRRNEEFLNNNDTKYTIETFIYRVCREDTTEFFIF